MDSKQMHVCRLCDKLLSSSSSLDRHMLTHSGERPFVCKRCQMTFTTNGNMHRHMRTHLHKDSLARQQQEQQLKSLVGDTSLSALTTTNPTSSPAAATTTAVGQTTTANTLTSQQLAPNNQICDPAASMAAAAAAAMAIAAGRPFGGGRDPADNSSASAMSQHHQQDTTSSVTALLNQQLVAALKKQQQQLQPSNRAAAAAAHNRSPPSAALHVDTTASTGAGSDQQLFRNTLVGVQDLVSTSPAHSTAVASANSLSMKMAPENAASNFPQHHQQLVDPKALMMGHLQGDQLESVKAVMLAAAAAAAAAAASQQNQHQQHQKLLHHHNHHHNSKNHHHNQLLGLGNRLSDGQQQQLLMQVKRETSAPDDESMDQADEAEMMGGDHQLSSPPPARHRLRCKRRKQVNPRCSTRPAHLSSAASLNGANSDDDDDGRRSSESATGGCAIGQQHSNATLSARLRSDDDSISSGNSRSGSTFGRMRSDDILANDNTNVVNEDDDQSTDAGEHDAEPDQGRGDANNNNDKAAAATAIKREDFNNNDKGGGAVENNIDKIKREPDVAAQHAADNLAGDRDDAGSQDGELDDDEDQELENEDGERTFNASSTASRINTMMITSDDDEDDEDDDDDDRASLSSSGVNISMSDNNNSSQMPFAHHRNTNNNQGDSIHSDQQQHHSIRLQSLPTSNSSNNFDTTNHYQSSLDQIHQQQNHSLPIPLTTVNGEVIEDISQSYVKTTNPNAARKGGKRNRHCYKCKLCTYSSVDRCTLVRHLRIHSGERPYICGICRYAFTTKANCERHVRKRHKKQYNSLGGAGGGGVKGSNGGGRSLIITDHSNHQTIPVKVNPVAAQTISQTLQRIQEKQQHQTVNNNNNNNNINNSADDEMDNIERIPNHQHSQHHIQQQKHADAHRINETTSLGVYKSKRKHRGDERLDDTAVPYQRRRLIDKHEEVFGSTRLSSRKNIINETQLNGSNLFNPQPGPFANNANVPDMPSTNELFANLMAQLQQATSNPHEPSNNINGTDNGTQNLGSFAAQATSQGPDTHVTSATFLANMLAAGKSLGVDGQQGLGPSQSSLLSPKHLSQQLAQLRNLNSQAPFFIRRNPFDPFNPLDLAAQALDLSCKFQSSK